LVVCVRVVGETVASDYAMVLGLPRAFHRERPYSLCYSAEQSPLLDHVRVIVCLIGCWMFKHEYLV
jgi:hypothetical protein